MVFLDGQRDCCKLKRRVQARKSIFIYFRERNTKNWIYVSANLGRFEWFLTALAPLPIFPMRSLSCPLITTYSFNRLRVPNKKAKGKRKISRAFFLSLFFSISCSVKRRAGIVLTARTLSEAQEGTVLLVGPSLDPESDSNQTKDRGNEQLARSRCSLV